MGEVFRITKVNELAKQLLKHGIASNMEEAVKQAEQLVRGESNENIREVKTPEQIMEEKAEEQSTLKKQGELEEVKERLNVHDKAIFEMQNKINEIVSEINSMEEALKKILNILQKNKIESTEGPNEDVKQKTKEQDTKPTPRTGDYTPENIRIEDYFYYGNKKKD